MLTRRSFMAGAALASAALSSPSWAGALRASIFEDASVGLRTAAQSRGVLYGAAMATYQLRDEAFATALAREAAILVPEYEMKRGVVEPARGIRDFAACDRIWSFAHDHAMQLRGHPLLWHRRNPDWLEDAVRATRDEALIADYVGDVVRHFSGRIHSWDVVNEAIAPQDGRPDGMRRTFWLDTFGPSYVDIAFHAARQADPDALLVYNDWGCEAGGDWNDRFRAATLSFLERALVRGVPIQALGLQGHFAAFGTPVDQAKLRAFLDRVTAMGLAILVTEHDVDDSNGPIDVAARDRAVADCSRRFLDVVLDCNATKAVLTWGLSDRFLASPGWRAEIKGYSPRFLPLDRDLGRKPMWRAMATAFGGDA